MSVACFKYDDYQTLANEIEDVLSTDTAKMVDRNYKLIKNHFSIPSVNEKLRKIYSEI